MARPYKIRDLDIIDNITRAVHIHPGLSEVVLRAAHDIQTKM